MYIVFDQGFESWLSYQPSVRPVLAAEPAINLDFEFYPLKLQNSTTFINTHNQHVKYNEQKYKPNTLVSQSKAHLWNIHAV